MIIGIDASRAFLAKRTGIEEYSYQLIKHLRHELAEERVVLYVRATNNRQQTTNNKQSTVDDKRQTTSNQQSITNGIDFELPEKWEVRELWAPRFWTQGRLAIEMLLHPVDVLFVPAHTVPWIHPKRTVVVIHGLEYEFCPETYSLWERIYMRWSIRNSCQWASSIIAVSENTKRDLVSRYGVPKEKMQVVYEGVSCLQFPTDNEQSDSKPYVSKFSISNPYFLFIGRIEARKNVGRIIAAFDLFKKKHGTDHQLVLAGKPGFGYAAISDQLKTLRCWEDVVETGYVSEEEKRQLLRNANGFLFPTLYEGFGLPVLEAQSAGVSVVTSNVSSLPEVSGSDSAIFVDPLNVEEIARGIEKIALDQGFRSGIIERGLQNAARFSWEQCAKEVSKILLHC